MGARAVQVVENSVNSAINNDISNDKRHTQLTSISVNLNATIQK
jgi:hypothetical protein